MRLSYKTYPIWAEIETARIQLSSIDSTLKTLVENAGGLTPWHGAMCVAAQEAIRGNLNFLTRPFRAAIVKSIPKIVGSTKEYLERKIAPSILMHEGGGTIVFNSTEIDSLKVMLVGFDRNKIVAWGTMNTENFGVGGWGDKKFLENYKFQDGGDEHQMMSDWFIYILTTNYFINNCEIETKELKPKEKSRTAGEKHLNESKKTLRILDCTWFTTLVSNIPQHVNGFLRWQPYGTGRLLRKLIWIDSFIRNGFTRKAKALHESQQTNTTI